MVGLFRHVHGVVCDLGSSMRAAVRQRDGPEPFFPGDGVYRPRDPPRVTFPNQLATLAHVRAAHLRHFQLLV